MQEKEHIEAEEIIKLLNEEKVSRQKLLEVTLILGIKVANLFDATFTTHLDEDQLRKAEFSRVMQELMDQIKEYKEECHANFEFPPSLSNFLEESLDGILNPTTDNNEDQKWMN